MASDLNLAPFNANDIPWLKPADALGAYERGAKVREGREEHQTSMVERRNADARAANADARAANVDVRAGEEHQESLAERKQRMKLAGEEHQESLAERKQRMGLGLKMDERADSVELREKFKFATDQFYKFVQDKREGVFHSLRAAGIALANKNLDYTAKQNGLEVGDLDAFAKYQAALNHHSVTSGSTVNTIPPIPVGLKSFKYIKEANEAQTNAIAATTTRNQASAETKWENEEKDRWVKMQGKGYVQFRYSEKEKVQPDLLMKAEMSQAMDEYRDMHLDVLKEAYNENKHQPPRYLPSGRLDVQHARGVLQSGFNAKDTARILKEDTKSIQDSMRKSTDAFVQSQGKSMREKGMTEGQITQAAQLHAIRAEANFISGPDDLKLKTLPVGTTTVGLHPPNHPTHPNEIWYGTIKAPTPAAPSPEPRLERPRPPGAPPSARRPWEGTAPSTAPSYPTPNPTPKWLKNK